MISTRCFFAKKTFGVSLDDRDATVSTVLFERGGEISFVLFVFFSSYIYIDGKLIQFDYFDSYLSASG